MREKGSAKSGLANKSEAFDLPQLPGKTGKNR